ncbi:MAG TPA: SPOR domain-containing protein [Gammaproteobacteria bacterium]|nr:SPOR domain-containing protein [Gammaproteobacteria bacterium]
MDIGIKERVIGAVVLVVLGIIIIPWVLQGPAPDSAVTRNVPLPAASTADAPREYRMDLGNTANQVPASTPNPVAQTPQPQAVAPKQVSTASTGAAGKSQPIERSTAGKGSDTGAWMVQAGSYGSESNARRLQKTLEKHGYRVVISRYASGSKTWYRVRVGPYTERAAAEKQLAAIGHLYGGKPKVVPNP